MSGSRWYQSVPFVIFMLIALGPFALPLLWKSPAFNFPAKIIITIVTIALTIWMLQMTAQMTAYIYQQFKALAEAYTV